MIKKKADILIVGGGAAGLFASLVASEHFASVIIIEHTSRVGKKLLSTGNGRCNLSNITVGPESYRGEEPSFAASVIERFDNKASIDYFKQLGVYTTTKDGRIYPRTEQASTVLDALRIHAKERKIDILTDSHIKKLKKDPNDCTFIAVGNIKHPEEELKDDTFEITAKSVILCCGGLAAPNTGSDGSGYDLAISFGHELTDTMPALTGLYSDASFLKSLAGVRALAKITLKVNDENIYTETGELQIVKDAISGIPVFNASRFAAYALKNKKKTTVSIDLTPEIETKKLKAELFKRRNIKNISAADALNGLLNKKLCVELCKLAGFKPSTAYSELSDTDIGRLTGLIKDFDVGITGIYPYKSAQVTAGGIKTSQINAKTMGSRLIEGLYFAGEIVDVDGMCGGYNLQWAWSSAHLAASSAVKHL